MSQLLLSELAALSSESKRKNPEVKAASDVALAALRTDEHAQLKKSRENSRPEEDVLLKPILLACSAKATSAKVVSLAVGLLQRIIGIRAIREDENHMATIVDVLTNVVTSRADVDVHLKVLQVVSSLLSSYHSIHDKQLSKTLRLCFRLQDSRIAVVSSTAAATLRQAVMIVFEKVREEDTRREGGGTEQAGPSLSSTRVEIPGTDGVTLFASSRDAYLTITDLNALANGEPAPFLSLSSLPRTFTLELIESVLTNHAHLFRSDTHPELLFCLRQSTCPLLIKAFNEQAVFPTTLRLMRLLFVLLRQFSSELVVEVEILMSILLKCVASPPRKSSGGHRSSVESSPPWQRVLAMEATRSLCADGVLLRNMWKWFDGKANSAGVFTSLVDTLHQLATENPAITGKAEASHQMSDAPLQDSARRPSSDRGYSSLYGAAAGVATAAISGFSTMADSNAGLSQTSVPGVQLIDQLDKSEAPSPPASYIYLLALQSLVHLAQSLAAYVLPIYSRYVNSRPKSSPRAPPALEFSILTKEEEMEMSAVKQMLQQCWAPVLNSSTFFLASKCDDVLFAEVLIALRNFTNATGVLGLESPRDALVATLARFAVPRSVIAKLVSLRGKAASNGQEELECTLSERNAACLKAVTQIAYYLSGSIGTHWRDVLETLCDAEFVLRKGGSRRRSRSVSADEPQTPIVSYQPKASMTSISALSTVPPGFYSASAMDTATGRPMALTNIDSETLLAEVARVFENTAALGDDAFLHFIEALCELDADSIELAKGSSTSAGTVVNRSFPLSSLVTVAMLNVQRLTTLAKDMGWTRVVEHLLRICSSSLRPSLRLQSAEGLDHFLNAALRVKAEDAGEIQQRALEAVTEQSILGGKRQVAADVDVRRLGLETLLGILEVHGHSLLLGWEMIFKLCAAASAPSSSDETGVADDASVRTTTALVKTAFTSLQLVCSDLLTKLDLTQLEGCVRTLTLFSKQKEDINVALTANGTLWAVTAEISGRADGADSEADDEQITSLWIYVLKSVLQLTSDERVEVRNGAISILFNILEQYGSRLSRTVWTSNVINGILFPLLGSLRDNCAISGTGNAEKDANAALMGTASASSAKQWEESRALALSSTGKVIRQSFTDKLAHDASVFEKLLQYLKEAFVQGPSSISQAAIRAMHNITQVDAKPDEEQTREIWMMAWQTWSSIGLQLVASEAVFTQVTLLAYIKTLEPIYRLIGKDLNQVDVQKLLSCIKAALVYDKAKEKISDADRLTPLQSAILSMLSMLHIGPHTATMVLQDLSEYTTLAFSGSKQASYLALNRASTLTMLEFYSTWSQEVQIYESGAVGHMFAALLIPLKLRYDCPRGRQEEPIWKGSLTTFCKSVALCCERMDNLSLSASVVADIWMRIAGALQAALSADCSAILEMSAKKMEEEETFDLTLLSTIERDVWPFLGRDYVPQACVSDIAKALSQSSRLYISDYDSSREACEDEQDGKEEEKIRKEQGYLAPIDAVPRETFAYWCFDLLLLLSTRSETESAPEVARNNKRVAALFLPHLMERISQTLSQYIAEGRLRGMGPASRLKDEEINYIFGQLQTMELWAHSLRVAEGTLALQAYLDDEVETNTGDVAMQTLSSPKALLYHVYPLLCDFLLYITPRTGSTMLSHRTLCGSSAMSDKQVQLPAGFQLGRVGQIRTETSDGGVVELKDAREMARDLLGQIGAPWHAQSGKAKPEQTVH